MPSPTYDREELQKMIAIAQRNKDAQILGYAYEQVRAELLREPSAGQLSRVRGRELMARMDMIKEGERFIAAVKYRDFRQVPIKDNAGLDYTKSIREVEPRSALELIVRHFTDSRDQKRERQQIRESARQQVATAEARSIKAAEAESWSLNEVPHRHIKRFPHGCLVNFDAEYSVKLTFI